MKIFLVLAHAEPRSFNAALFQVAADVLAGQGHEIKTSDLYDMRFDPVSDRRNFTSVKDPVFFKQQVEEMHATEMEGFARDIEAELRKLEWCDLMIWQFPLWWFGLPAILKGWVDRVFAMGRTYSSGRIYEQGFFRGKRAMISLTTGGAEEGYAKDGFNGDIHAILRPIHRGMLEFIGFDVLTPHIVYQPAHLVEARRVSELRRYQQRLQQIENEAPYVVGKY